MATPTNVLDEALKLSVEERVRLAEKLLESADAEGFDDEDAVVQAAWTAEIQTRSNELKSGAVRGVSAEEALRIIADDSDLDR
ncbi:MAG TPA: addiction module protein [Kofleriaceae bacterium]|jgi:putative addiction module component (TIGR02574 family)